jgi:signal transduction histidine kinase
LKAFFVGTEPHTDTDATTVTDPTFSVKDVIATADRFVDEMKEEALIIVSRPGGLEENIELFQKVIRRAKSVGATVKILAHLKREEIRLANELQQGGAEIRNLALGQRLNMSGGIYDRKNMGLVYYLSSDGEAPSQESRKPTQVSGLISTNSQMVGWVAQVFGILWDSSISVQDRAAQLEEGVDPPKLDVIRDPALVRQRILDMIVHAGHELLFLFPTVGAFHRAENVGVVDKLGACASRGVRVNMLSPSDDSVEQTIRRMNSENQVSSSGGTIGYRRISSATTRNTVTILVVDRKSSLVMEQRDDSQPDFDRAVGLATYSTSNSTVLAAIRFFERMWDEVEMREREGLLLENERRSRKTAQLLQDIMSHDIRNYNQIAKLNIEVLREDPEMSLAERERHFEVLARAIDNSTSLIDKAKRLGKILSLQDVRLEAKDLEESFERSLSVVREANPDKSISVSVRFEHALPRVKAMVLADDLLDEAVTNILSNAVKYTEGQSVNLQVEFDREERSSLGSSRGHEKDLDEPETNPESPGSRRGYWKLSITDWGKGIPDGMKAGIFNRYLETAKGSGLGLSIVRALIVERYSGEVSIKNRIQDDPAKGTVVRLWIPEATTGKQPAPFSMTKPRSDGNDQPSEANPS